MVDEEERVGLLNEDGGVGLVLGPEDVEGRAGVRTLFEVCLDLECVADPRAGVEGGRFDWRWGTVFGAEGGDWG